MGEKLCKECKKVELEVNDSKTKIMSNKKAKEVQDLYIL